MQNYKNLAEAEVFKKDGLVLVREMAEEVHNMMNFKINAVMVSCCFDYIHTTIVLQLTPL